MQMKTSALVLVVLSQTVVAAQCLAAPATAPAVVELEVAQATPDQRRIRRLQRRRLGLLYGSAAPLIAGIVLSIRGYVLAPDDDDYVVTDTGYRRAEFSPVRSVLGGIGIAAGIFMLGRSRRVGRHARQLEHPPSLGAQRRRHERRFRRLTGIGGAFLLVGVGTGIVAAVVGDDCDDDGFLCIPTGVLLAMPAVAFAALGGVLILRGMTNRRRGRAIQRVQVGLGAGSARLHLQF